MKIKTSVTLSDDLLAVLARCAGLFRSRSEFLETAAWAYLSRIPHDGRDARDLEILR